MARVFWAGGSTQVLCSTWDPREAPSLQHQSDQSLVTRVSIVQLLNGIEENITWACFQWWRNAPQELPGRGSFLCFYPTLPRNNRPLIKHIKGHRSCFLKMVAMIWTVLLRANTLAYFSLFVCMAHQMRTRCREMVLIRDFFCVYLTVWQAVETFEVFYRFGWWLFWLSALNAKVKVMFGYLAGFHKWSDYVLKATRRTCQLESRTCLNYHQTLANLGSTFPLSLSLSLSNSTPKKMENDFCNKKHLWKDKQMPVIHVSSSTLLSVANCFYNCNDGLFILQNIATHCFAGWVIMPGRIQLSAFIQPFIHLQ